MCPPVMKGWNYIHNMYFCDLAAYFSYICPQMCLDKSHIGQIGLDFFSIYHNLTSFVVGPKKMYSLSRSMIKVSKKKEKKLFKQNKRVGGCSHYIIDRR